jgi:hypothetical protein
MASATNIFVSNGIMFAMFDILPLIANNWVGRSIAR